MVVLQLFFEVVGQGGFLVENCSSLSPLLRLESLCPCSLIRRRITTVAFTALNAIASRGAYLAVTLTLLYTVYVYVSTWSFSIVQMCSCACEGFCMCACALMCNETRAFFRQGLRGKKFGGRTGGYVVLFPFADQVKVSLEHF